MRSIYTSLITAMAVLALAAATSGANLSNVKASDTVDAKLVSTGHTLFLTNCSPCHGAQAQGDDGPNLHHQGLTNADVETTVKSGVKGEMPSFSHKLSPHDVDAVAAYIRSLQ